MNIREILTIIIVLAAVFSYINHRWIKWPSTIGIMALSLMLSLALLAVEKLGWLSIAKANQLASSIDLNDLLMKFMLSFLLFAGSIHVNLSRLKEQFWPVTLLSTMGTIISTVLIGVCMWYLFGLFHLSVPLVYCLLFGALISPTDPVAVLGILRKANIPPSLEMKISGESLFNDGVGVVIFISIAEVAQAGGDFSIATAGKLFLQEALGGLLFGAVLGYLCYAIINSIDDYKTEVLITLAIVTGGYLVADRLHISGPLAMIVAGIITGNQTSQKAMSAVSRDYLEKFWELIDEMLNTVLFLLIGIKMLVVNANFTMLLIGALSIVLVLAMRWISVGLPVLLLRWKIGFEKHAVTILTWGGLRGGISVALALSLTKEMHGDQFVPITYMIVLFSILVQGLTIGPLARKLQKEA